MLCLVPAKPNPKSRIRAAKVTKARTKKAVAASRLAAKIADVIIMRLETTIGITVTIAITGQKILANRISKAQTRTLIMIKKPRAMIKKDQIIRVKTPRAIIRVTETQIAEEEAAGAAEVVDAEVLSLMTLSQVKLKLTTTPSLATNQKARRKVAIQKTATLSLTNQLRLLAQLNRAS